MKKIILLFLFLLFTNMILLADGIDIFSYITSLPDLEFTPFYMIIFFIILLLIINYFINFIILVPSFLITKKFDIKKIFLIVLIITIIGQIIDRIGAGFSILFVLFIEYFINLDMGSSILILVLSRYIFILISITIAVYFIISKFIIMKNKTKIIISIIMGIFSNPLWGDIILFKIQAYF